MKESDVFMSYAKPDLELAKEWRWLLQSGDLRTFLAEQDIPAGAPWKEAIRDALQGTKLLLMLLTPHSQNRRWQQWEAAGAWALGKPIILGTAFVDLNTLDEPLRDYQARIIETDSQKESLVAEIIEMAKTIRSHQ